MERYKVYKEKLLEVLPKYIDFASDRVFDCSDIGPELEDHVRFLIEFTVTGGKFIRACILIDTYLQLSKTEEIPEDVLFCAWSVEVLQAAYLTADDIIDVATLRRGKLPFYKTPMATKTELTKMGKSADIKQPDVGLTAFIDAWILETASYETITFVEKKLLKQIRFLDKKSAFPDEIFDYFFDYPLLDVLMYCGRMTELGECLDCRHEALSRAMGSCVSASFSQVKKIHIHKTSFYTFYLPYALGVVLYLYHHPEDVDHVLKEVPGAIKVRPGVAAETKDIATGIDVACVCLGRLFQMQDDFFDLFCPPEKLGKVGTDIQEGKASWLLCYALDSPLLTESMRKVLADNIGNSDADCRAVRNVYEAVEVEKGYKTELKKISDKISTALKPVDERFSEPLLILLRYIVGRDY
ncbi:putative multi-domain containing protein [Aduncisulcus paluster]|uniref:Multi-domain containing protein n=1 Tax=Aduncisulcus paluster TaxID=2918883 RepID=A0ABQ5K537_9EUKA|nr:putative multi-domain containing protein [Aduncisulcus paluster]|eukprot:gnl/Carplike_NY0171/5703_a7817_216.p1 GENE.gnl/Carplike_NY0171/5703_a7817_216~~gnl/Carplike_NY0171/5703_a7817_216.p1  ORF type:complete len:411 (-),score=82.51 gnl/Carplike_NY0171/5703_a7817_216:96-1328(-)